MVLLAICSIKGAKSNVKFILFSALLCFLMAFKAESIGNDTYNYIYFFEYINEIDSLYDPFSRFEIGFQIYNKILGYISNDVQILFVISSVICFSCLIYSTKKLSLNWIYTLFLFVGLRFYYFFLSGLRQSIAVSIILVSYVMLKEEKKIKYFLLVLLASTFHFSALIFLVAWPLRKLNFNRYNFLKIVTTTLILYIFFDNLLLMFLSVLPAYYSHYLDSDAVASNNLANYIYTLINLTFLLFAYYSGYIEKIRSKLNRLQGFDTSNIQLFFLLISTALSFIATRASILDRFVQYFWIFSIFSISNILFSMHDQKSRAGWYLIVSILVFAFNITLLIYRPMWTQIVPYRFFWNN